MVAEIKRSPWLVIEGVVLIVLGVLALIVPAATGLATSLIIGLVLLVSGIAGLISSFAGRPHVHAGLGFASAVVSIAVGLLLVLFPLAGPVIISVLLAIYLIADGVILIGLAIDLRRRVSPRWGWMMASGVLGVLLGVALLLVTGIGSAVLVGLFIGVDLIVGGAVLLLIHHKAPALRMAAGEDGVAGMPL